QTHLSPKTGACLCICTYSGVMVDFHDRQLRDRPLPGDERRWLELLDSLDLDELTERFMTRVVRVPGYDPAPIPVSELRRTGRLSFTTLIEGLRAGGFDGPVAISTEVGVSRARAGIPLEALMTAIRHDFNVLWEVLTGVAEPTAAELVIRLTGIVPSTADEYASQEQQASTAELQRRRAGGEPDRGRRPPGAGGPSAGGADDGHPARFQCGLGGADPGGGADRRRTRHPPYGHCALDRRRIRLAGAAGLYRRAAEDAGRGVIGARRTHREPVPGSRSDGRTSGHDRLRPRPRRRCPAPGRRRHG